MMSETRPFPDDYYDENGIYIPRLYGRPWQYWYKKYGCTTMKDIIARAEEERMDLIGLNGNVGYEELEWKK